MVFRKRILSMNNSLFLYSGGDSPLVMTSTITFSIMLFVLSVSVRLQLFEFKEILLIIKLFAFL